jgi:hypothetical protein
MKSADPQVDPARRRADMKTVAVFVAACGLAAIIWALYWWLT